MIDTLVQGFDSSVFCELLNEKFGGSFSAVTKRIPIPKDLPWKSAQQLGVVKTLPGPENSNMPLLVVVAELPEGEELRERSSRIKQFHFARKVLDQAMSAPLPGVEGLISQGLFVFHDEDGNFRLSFVYGKPVGTKLVWSEVRRQSFYVEAGAGNKTFRDRAALSWSPFDDLKEAFSVEKLAKEFYSRLFQWYQWALSDEMGVTYPNDIHTHDDDREINEHIIRLITRLMFVWFLKQKHLVPDDLFDPGKLKHILKKFSTTSGDTYYRAILQNLFFATLNSEIPERGFATQTGDRTEHFDIKTLYRYPKEFALSEKKVLDLFKGIPFLNGGLFECLDRGRNYYDGFSRNRNKQARVPNALFFDPKDGLIPLLRQYNFTIEENSPGDEEVALDPELLGKVFENLLGTYNPETEVAARKATGSFYTPREIVTYMVDESLMAHLKGKCGDEHEDDIRKLFADSERPTSAKLCQALDEALVTAKVLDPACGSGAFPMGVLLRMVEVLRVLRGIPEEESVYDLKLELIENCIYGADIQCIAVQISKLRFFISLVCEQKPTADVKKNYGIDPLPNLETKFVAANTLIGLPREGDMLPMQNVEALKKQLWGVRHRHFLARSYQEKKKLRGEDRKLRTELAKLLEQNGAFDTDSAGRMAEWDPYDQNTSAGFLDPEWMFNVRDGFDVVIGNPPYIDSEGMTLLYPREREIYRGIYNLSGNWDIYISFFWFANNISNGVFCFITPDKWLSRPFGKIFRKDVVSEKLALLVHCGTGVFENVTVDAIISLFSSDPQNAQFGKYNQDREIDIINKCSLSVLKDPYLLDQYFSSDSKIIASIEKDKPLLSQYWECENACSTADAYALVPLIKEGNNFDKLSGSYRLINTGTLSKVFALWGKRPITYLTKNLGYKPLYPIVMKKEFTSKFGKTYIRRAASKKLISKGLNLLDVCLDLEGQYIPGKSTLVICEKDDAKLKTLCAVLNSHLAVYYFKIKYSSSSYCGGTSFTPDMLNSFPVVSGEADDYLVSLVDSIIEQGSILPRNMDDINAYIYKIYGLGEDDIAVIEESVNKSAKRTGKKAAKAKKAAAKPKAKATGAKKTVRRRKTQLPPSLPGWD
ncbi:MAG: Eco57I restriction-modification methylase domain-containing protein [Kiritimatiellia bacterium]|nr:Eco57I restriction-modification methylase domain-containing protein [Kiritimatiellia bacterium]